MPKDSNNLVWIDLEMTGLDPDTDRILEIASIVTDAQLEILAEGPVLALHQSEAVLGRMDQWNTTHHADSGLLARVRESSVDEAQAERLTLAFLRQWVPEGASPLCGNSIGTDRRFLYRLMPALEAFCHYRNIDVSTIKELARRWAPDVPPMEKAGAHLALADIRESIAELRYYREHLFRV